jgi:hypothetical protein
MVVMIHGLSKLSRWTGTEVLNHTAFMVPAPIFAYNNFMNGVDWMDQYRATLAMQRKEVRIHMTIWTFCLDLAITQAYAVYRKAATDKGEPYVSFFKFKRRICAALIAPLQTSNQ